MKNGKPIVGAIVERSPNRYTADDWIEDTETNVWKAVLRLVGNPKLAFRSIQSENKYPTVRTDTRGRYCFDNVKLGEYVLTVESPGYTPQHRHIEIDAQPEPLVFTLRPGRLLCGQVVDSDGRLIGWMCVVLDRWHCHTDGRGYFYRSGEAPVPKYVTTSSTIASIRRYGSHTATDLPRSPCCALPRILQRFHWKMAERWQLARTCLISDRSSLSWNVLSGCRVSETIPLIGSSDWRSGKRLHVGPDSEKTNEFLTHNSMCKKRIEFPARSSRATRIRIKRYTPLGTAQ